MAETLPRKPDYVLFAAVGTLVLLGLVMVYSASFMRAYADTGDQLYYTWRQMTAAVIGVVALLAAQRIDYRIWRRVSVHLMAGALFLLLLTLILPASMTEANGARSWIRVGSFSMQPSEIAKLVMVIYFADWLSRRGEKLTNVTYGLAPFALMLGIVCGLVILGRDLGTTIVLVIVAGVVYFAAGASLLHIIGAAIVAGSAFWGLINIATYRMERIAAWIDPFAHYQARVSTGSRALRAGKRRVVWRRDRAGASEVLLAARSAYRCHFRHHWRRVRIDRNPLRRHLFLVIAYRGMRIAGRSSDPFAALLATGITCWIVGQALINIAVVTTLIPFTGLTLPFISYGGTSLTVCMAAAGILLNISRHTGHASPGESHETVVQSERSASFARLAGWWRNRRSRLSGADRRRGAQRAWGAIRRR